jgi:hypothetical protein
MATRKTKANPERQPKTASPGKKIRNGVESTAGQISGTVFSSSASAAMMMRGARPTEDEIRERAYQLYLQRGCGDGRDIDDWLVAERQLGVSRAVQ